MKLFSLEEVFKMTKFSKAIYRNNKNSRQINIEDFLKENI